MSLSQKLKLLRAKHNMTQEQLAAQINVARATISGYETKDRQPSHEKLTSIAEVFHVSVDYLLGNEDTSSITEFSLLQEHLLDERDPSSGGNLVPLLASSGTVHRRCMYRHGRGTYSY